MLGYKFETKQIADDAMKYLNSHHGLPTDWGTSYFGEESYKLHTNGFYYIEYNEYTSCLGEPIEIIPPLYTLE